jgi:hypothetical protein
MNVGPYKPIQYKAVSVTAERQQAFSMVTARLYVEPCREGPFIRKKIQKLSVQLWSVNQRTTEAEEVADS